MSTDRKEIAEYLADVRKSVQEKRCVFSPRDKNEQLFVDYIFDEKMRGDILLDLEVEDFCDVLKNEHPNFAHERLFVFGKKVQLIPRFGGDEKTVSLYTDAVLFATQNDAKMKGLGLPKENINLIRFYPAPKLDGMKNRRS